MDVELGHDFETVWVDVLSDVKNGLQSNNVPFSKSRYKANITHKFSHHYPRKASNFAIKDTMRNGEI